VAQKLGVVLVDDSRSALARLQALVERIDGVAVVGTATDGVAALRVVGEVRPHLVLMDIVMPGLDGLASLRLLRSQYPGVRVALLSSVGGSTSRAEEAFRLGAVQVVSKPVEEDVLVALLERERERLAAPEACA
jgi:YesN/AraC family two-component response regulator